LGSGLNRLLSAVFFSFPAFSTTSAVSGTHPTPPERDAKVANPSLKDKDYVVIYLQNHLSVWFTHRKSSIGPFADGGLQPWQSKGQQPGHRTGSTRTRFGTWSEPIVTSPTKPRTNPDQTPF
jgi:hypothetical protein